jgi:S-adenosylmethionine-dependent methyltransferase
VDTWIVCPPPSPQDPFEILGWLEAVGLDVKFRAGARVAFDYLGKDLKARRSNDDLLAVENLLREQEAFWGLGRYVHFIAMKPG